MLISIFEFLSCDMLRPLCSSVVGAIRLNPCFEVFSRGVHEGFIVAINAKPTQPSSGHTDGIGRVSGINGSDNCGVAES